MENRLETSSAGTLERIGKRALAFVVLIVVAVVVLKIISVIFIGLVTGVFTVVAVLALIAGAIWALRRL